MFQYRLTQSNYDGNLLNLFAWMLSDVQYSVRFCKHLRTNKYRFCQAMIGCNNNIGFEMSARVEESMFEASLEYWGFNESKIWVIYCACREHTRQKAPNQ